MTSLLQDLLAWVSANPMWAHLVVFLIALVESLAVVGLIVPGVIMMLGAGALIATGVLDFWPVCAWAIAGAVTGDGLSYWLGRHFKDRLRALWPFSRYPQSLAAGERFFAKYGGKSVAIGRFVGPVRAVIPLVAGMMGMGAGRFLLANVLSAILWSPAYLLPGIVFGASLELAAEAAVRLVLAVLILVLLVWLTAWIVRQLFLLYSPKAGRWVEGLLRWAELHPYMGEIARALADPDHPDAKTLTVLAAMLLLTTVTFGLVTGLVLAGAPELGPNRLVLDLALSLHSPATDHLMVATTRLADVSVILPLILVVYGWLLLRGQGRHASYWLAAGAFAMLAGPLLEVLLQVPRPDIGLTELSPWGFPSSHTLRATVVYGFLAISLADPMTPTWRWAPYVWAAVLTMAVGVSRLYFGALWLTDVLGSLTLGLAWVAVLGLALRRHTHAAASWRGLGLVSVGTLALAFGFASLFSHGEDLALYQPRRETVTMTESDWRTSGWRSLPQQRQDLSREGGQPMNLQLAGDPALLERALTRRGWAPGQQLSIDNGIKLFSPSLPLRDLPVIPHVHDGRHEAFVLVKDEPEDRRLVLRLWSTRYRIDGEIPLWLGNVTAQHKRVMLDLIALPTTDGNSPGPLRSLSEGLRQLQPSRPAPNGPMLLTTDPRFESHERNDPSTDRHRFSAYSPHRRVSSWGTSR